MLIERLDAAIAGTGADAIHVSTGVLLRWGDIDLLAPSRLRRKYRTA